MLANWALKDREAPRIGWEIIDVCDIDEFENKNQTCVSLKHTDYYMTLNFLEYEVFLEQEFPKLLERLKDEYHTVVQLEILETGYIQYTVTWEQEREEEFNDLLDTR